MSPIDSLSRKPIKAIHYKTANELLRCHIHWTKNITYVTVLGVRRITTINISYIKSRKFNGQ